MRNSERKPSVVAAPGRSHPGPDRRGGGRSPGLVARLLRCRLGSLGLEFAFALPIVVLITAGLVEVAMVLFVTALAEGGLREASRYGITGRESADISREERILEIVQQHTHGLIPITGADLDIKVYPGFDNIQEAEPYGDANANGQFDDGETFDDLNGNETWDAGNGTAGPGQGSEVVRYRLEFDWNYITPVFAVFGGPDGTMKLSASIVVQNEPFHSGVIAE